MRFSKSILIAAVTMVAPFIGHAASVKSNPTLSIGSFTFDNFSCDVTHQGSAGPGGCGKIDVNTITKPGTGIEFSSGFVAGSLGSVAFDDAVIHYDVSSTKGINSVGLDFNGIFFGYAVSSVTESVYSGDKLVGFAKVACGPDALGVGCVRQDNILLDGLYTDLHIIKDINVSSFLGLAEISYVDQTFGTATPEPSSFALLGSALVGVGGLIRRRRKNAAQA